MNNKEVYNYIISYLIEEGYAETPESAYAIMENMSEDWAYSIIDEGVALRVVRSALDKMEVPPRGSLVRRRVFNKLARVHRELVAKEADEKARNREERARLRANQ